MKSNKKIAAADPPTPTIPPPLSPYKEAVRSLRRRLWKAFQEEDLETAIRAYSATVSQYEEWCAQERREMQRQRKDQEEARLREKQEKREARPVVLKKVGAMARSVRNGMKPSDHKKGGKGTFPLVQMDQKYQKSGPIFSVDHSTEEPVAFIQNCNNDVSTLRNSIIGQLDDVKDGNGELCSMNQGWKDEKTTPLGFDFSTEELVGTPVSSSQNHTNGMGTTANMDSCKYSASDLSPEHITTGILQLEMNPSQPFMQDDYKSSYDSSKGDLDQKEAVIPPLGKKYCHSSKKHGRPVPRMAGFFGRRRGHSKKAEVAFSGIVPPTAATLGNSESYSNDNDGEIDESTTTPLHEAARLGGAALIRMMLAHGGDPNTRNGQAQTALHMTCGGLTEEEKGLLLAAYARKRRRSNKVKSVDREEPIAKGVGIRLLCIEKEEANRDNSSSDERTSPRLANLKSIGRRFKSSSPSLAKGNTSKIKVPEIPLDKERINRLVVDRMESVLAILSWSHPNNGTDHCEEGSSVNSVDARYRTALHYASELGRTNVCMAVLSSFGTILTLVDESGYTPCELAAERGHSTLAYQLEARALLYADPYGMDDELMAAVQADAEFNESANANDDDPKSGRQPALREECDSAIQAPHSYRKSLVPPFSWFATWDMEDVRTERTYRVNTLLQQMHIILKEIQEQHDANEIMFNHALNDSIEDGGTAIDRKLVALLWDGGGEEDCTSDKGEIATELSLDQEGGDFGVDGPLKNGKESLNDERNRYETAHKGFIDDGSKHAMKCRKKGFTDIIHESHAESLLINQEWNIVRALSEFAQSPEGALEKAGAPVVLASVNLEPSANQHNDDLMCMICCEDFSPHSSVWTHLNGCSHAFCSECLEHYISDRAQSNSSLIISCPHHECSSLLMQARIEALSPSPDVFKCLMKAADETFVTTATDTRFCPHPGCEGIIRRVVPQYLKQAIPETVALINLTGGVCTAVPKSLSQYDESVPLTYEGVRDPNYHLVNNMSPPLRAHRFCFSCGEDVHFPISCEMLIKWKDNIAEEVGLPEAETGEGSNKVKIDDVAQRLWLRANTRPCPRCSAPIQKVDGCNHVTCSNRTCRYEFCWICRKDWKLHTNETGGFYRCNIWLDEDNREHYNTPSSLQVEPAEDIQNRPAVPEGQGYGSAVHSARSAWKKSKAMARFLHYYRRWIAHFESATLERHMADTVCTRLAPVIEAAKDFSGFLDFNFGGKGLAFIHGAFTELLECRSLLQHSYAFSFTRYPTFGSFRNKRDMKIRARDKTTFEQLQSELETLSEQLSDIVARSHLRATQTQIIFLTSTTAEKRREVSVLLISMLDEAQKEEMKRKDDEEGGITATLSSNPPRSTETLGVDPIGNPLGRNNIDAPPMHRRTGDIPFAVPLGDFRWQHFPTNAPRNMPQPIPPNQIRGLHSAGFCNGGPQPLLPTSAVMANDFDQSEEIERALTASMQDLVKGGTAKYESYEATFDTHPGAGEDRWAANWDCRQCTYMNAGGRSCAMCGAPPRS